MNEELKKNIDDYIYNLILDDNNELTVRDNKLVLNDWYKFCQSNQIQTQTRVTALEYKQNLEKRNLKPASIRKYISHLRVFYFTLTSEGKHENIFAFIKTKKGKRKYRFRKKSLELEEAIKLVVHVYRKAASKFHTINDTRNYALVWLLLTTGMRCIEVHRSDRDDLQVDRKGRTHLWIQGKGHDSKDDFVNISSHTLVALNRYLDERSDDDKALFVSHPNGSLKKVTRLSSNNVGMIIKELLRQIGIDDQAYTAHSLRHTLGRVGLTKLNYTIDELQDQLRHEDPKTTRIYTEMGEKEDSELGEDMDKALAVKSFTFK